MFFEPDEFDQKLKKILTDELDVQNIFVSEDLIQRTLAAVKESDLIDDVITQEDSEKTQEQDDTEKSGNATDIMDENDLRNNEQEGSIDIKKTFEQEDLIDMKERKYKKHNKNRKVWLRGFSGIAAAALLLIVGMKVMDGSLSMGRADKKSTSSADTAQMKVETTLGVAEKEDSAEESAEVSTEESIEEGTGASNEASNEAAAESNTGASMEKSESITSSDVEFIVPSTGSHLDDKANISFGIASTENEEPSREVNLAEEQLLKDQEADVTGDSIYIAINYSLNEEQLLAWNNFMSSLKLTEKAEKEDTIWSYKIYVQEGEGYATSYFFSETGCLEIKDYDLNGTLSTTVYEFVDAENVLKELEKFNIE